MCVCARRLLLVLPILFILCAIYIDGKQYRYMYVCIIVFRAISCHQKNPLRHQTHIHTCIQNISCVCAQEKWFQASTAPLVERRESIFSVQYFHPPAHLFLFFLFLPFFSHLFVLFLYFSKQGNTCRNPSRCRPHYLYWCVYHQLSCRAMCTIKIAINIVYRLCTVNIKLLDLWLNSSHSRKRGSLFVEYVLKYIHSYAA